MTITVTDKNKITISTGQRGPQGIQGPAGSGAALTIQDEGVNLATDATTLNFVGAGISAVGTGATKTITVTGLGGGGSFSGDYNDLVNTPTFATIATSGDYTDLSNLPSLFDGNYNSLTNKPTLFSGSYNDLSNKPTLSTVATSGSYADLTNTPSLSTVATTGAYSDLSGTPTLASVATTGSYNDLTNLPATGSTLTIADEGSDLTTDATKLDFVGAGVVVSGTGTTKTVTITGGGAGSFSGSYTDLSNKPNVDDLSVGGDLDMGTNKVLYSNMYANLVDLPSATSYHGMFAHVHATGKAYYAHGGNWVEMANASDITTTLDYTAITNTPTLSTVATSGDYVDLTNKPTLFNGDYVNLTNKPTLGTAAATDTTAYATAAQGTKADTALQAADITGLTDDQTGAEIKTAYEAEANTNAYDDAAVTKLAGIETGADVTDTTNVVAALTAGNNITISAGGEIASTGGGGGTAITVEDEGTGLTTAASTLNFVGAGVTATGSGATKTITINGGSGGSAMTDSEVKTAYENNNDTNALTDANLTKLTNIEANADVTDTTNVVNALSAGTNVSISAAGVVDVTAAAITSVTVVSSQATQLALSTQQGDVVVRTDTNESYIRNSQSTGTMADFTLLQTPTSGVTSVAGSTGVVSTAQLKLAYEALANTNAFTDNEQSKLAGVEPLADVTDTTNVVSALTAGNNISISNAGVIASTTDPMTDSEVKTAYENNLDTNPFTDSDNTKLSNIEANAEVNAVQVSAAEITAATETATRSVSPADVKSFIDEHAGASSDMPIARYIDNVGGLNLASTSPVTHTDITTAVVEDTSIYSNSNGVVTVAESGNYMIKAAVGYAGLNYRAILNAKIIKNGTVTLTNVIGGYLRGQGHGDNSYVDLACVCTLAAGDTVQLTSFLNQGNTGTCTAVLGLCTLEFIKLSSSGSSSSVTLPDQVSAAEITAGTETAVRLYSPEDVKDMAIEHNPVSLTDEHMAITSSTTTTTTTPGTTVNIGEQDMTDSAWDYHTADGSLIGDNDWTLATRTTTSSTDSAGFAMYNIADTSASTANGQQGWQHAGILLTTSECPDNTSITLTTEVLKTSLTKPVQFLAADVNTGFQYQGWVELLSDGTLINQTPANATQITGTPTVVDKTTTWEVTFTVSRGTADMFVHIMPCLRNSDTGAYNKSAVGNCTVSPFRIKGTTPTTTTTTTIVNDLVQDKHIAPTQTTMVDGATLGTVNSNDVAFCIVMGQSNAAGTHGTSPTTASISNVYTMTAGNYNFSSYVNNNSNVYKTQGSNNSNPLTEITREWQLRKDANPLTTPDLYIINIAKGGTGFAWDINNNSQWDPFRRKNNAVFYDMPVAGTVTDDASLFYTAQKAIREALSQFAKEGKRAFHIGTIWNQWENDTQSANAVDRYPANLTLIRKMVDEELGLVDADFYPWRPVANFGTYATHGAQMKRTFDNFAANQNNVYLINTETFTNYNGTSPNFGIFQGDNLHYTQTTQQNAAKFVLDNGYFAVDGAGNSIRRAREVTMKVSDLQGISQMQPDGQITTVGISDTQTTTAADLNSV